MRRFNSPSVTFASFNIGKLCDVIESVFGKWNANSPTFNFRHMVVAPQTRPDPLHVNFGSCMYSPPARASCTAPVNFIWPHRGSFVCLYLEWWKKLCHSTTLSAKSQPIYFDSHLEVLEHGKKPHFMARRKLSRQIAYEVAGFLNNRKSWKALQAESCTEVCTLRTVHD